MTPARTICLGFLTVITAGAILLSLPFATVHPGWGNPLTALFTSTSAVCVTGLSVVDVGKFYTFWGQFFIVLLVQIGGLGYMTATTFLLLLVGRRFGLRDRIAIQQSLDLPAIAGGTQLIRSIIATTLLFELTGIFALLPPFVSDYGFSRGLWLAIFHSINSFNNAGFSLFSDSLIRYQGSFTVNLVVTALIIFGGVGYQVVMEMFFWLRDRAQHRKVCFVPSLNFKISVSSSITLLILGFLALWLTESRNPATFGTLTWPEKFMAAWFQSVTARTAGFNTIDFSQMTIASLFIVIVLMFIGASPGGTGGGIKTTTARILFDCTRAALRGTEELICYQRQIPLSLIMKAVGVMVGSVGVVIVSTTLIALSNPEIDFVRIFFEAVSAFGTVGLSTGITASISAFAQVVLIATMYVGRVGVLLMMSALLGDPRPTAIHYPEAHLLIG